jgi:hypothetical protein
MKQGDLQVEMDDAVAEGVYANLAVMSHSSSEFVIDFLRLMPGVPKAKVKSRIVMTPEHAKRLLIAMQDNVRKYESQFGDILLNDIRMVAPKGEA